MTLHLVKGVDAHEFRRRIDHLRSSCAAAGWDSYDALPLHVATVEKAIALAEILAARGLPCPFVYPLTNGGVTFEWTAGDWEISIETEPSPSPWRGDATNVKTGESTDFETEHDGVERAAVEMFAVAGVSLGDGQ